VLKIDDIISAGDLSTGGGGDEGGAPPAAWAAWAVWAVRCNHSVGYLHSRDASFRPRTAIEHARSRSGFVFGAVEARSSRVSCSSSGQYKNSDEERGGKERGGGVAGARSRPPGQRGGWSTRLGRCEVRSGAVRGGVGLKGAVAGGFGRRRRRDRGEHGTQALEGARTRAARSVRRPRGWGFGGPPPPSIRLLGLYNGATGTLERSTAGVVDHDSRSRSAVTLAHHSRGSLRRRRRRHYATDKRREVGRNRGRRTVTCPAGRCR